MTKPMSQLVHIVQENVLINLLLVAFLTFLVSGKVSAAGAWFEDGFEYSNVQDAIQAGPWGLFEGDVTLSSKYAHSGTTSVKICYAGNENISYITFDSPGMIKGANNGQTHLYLRWWELRAADYDWSGEKFNRVVGLFPNSNVTLDYPLGWVADGGWGQAGTNDAGSIQMFGNSSASNGLTHWKHTYKMPREEWHVFEYEIKLNDVGVPNGVSRLWIDDRLVVEAADIEFRYKEYTLDQIWIGGWYSGGNNPEPSPACRYVDDVSASTQKMGGSPPKPPTTIPPQP